MRGKSNHVVVVRLRLRSGEQPMIGTASKRKAEEMGLGSHVPVAGRCFGCDARVDDITIHIVGSNRARCRSKRAYHPLLGNGPLAARQLVKCTVILDEGTLVSSVYIPRSTNALTDRR